MEIYVLPLYYLGHIKQDEYVKYHTEIVNNYIY